MPVYRRASVHAGNHPVGKEGPAAVSPWDQLSRSES